MLRALLPVVAGILTAMHFALPLWLLVGGSSAAAWCAPSRAVRRATAV